MQSNKRLLGSIFSRLLISFCAIVLPLYLMSIGLYQWSQRKVTEQIHQSVYYQMNYFINDFDQSIARLKTLEYNYLLSDDTHRLAYAEATLSSYDRTKAIVRIQDAMTILHNSGELIESVCVYLPKSGRIIRSKDSLTKAPDYGPDTLAQMIDPNNSAAPLAFIDDQLHVYSHYPRFVSASNDELGIVIDAVLSKRRLLDMLDGLNAYEGGFVGLIFGNYAIGNHPPQPDADDLYLRFSAVSESSGIELLQYVPQEYISMELSLFRWWLTAFILLTIAVVLLYCVFIHRIIQRPINKLLSAFRSIGEGDLDIRIHHLANDDFSFIYQQFNQMAARLRAMIDEALAQRMLAQTAEMKQLQAQINPHFLYNSFFILRLMIKKENKDQALSFAELLGTYFRYVTRNGNQMTPLREEVEHAFAYARIHATRFENRISVELAPLPDAYADWRVPKLIIQPLLENAFEHGLRNALFDSMLRVQFLQEAGGLRVQVEDSGGETSDCDIEALNLRSGHMAGMLEYTGLFNINRRLELAYGAESRLRFSRSELGGLQVSFLIKKELLSCIDC